MNKTIDSKVYNTATATLIASEDNGHYPQCQRQKWHTKYLVMP